MCLMEPSVLASYPGLGTVRDRRSTFFNSLLANLSFPTAANLHNIHYRAMAFERLNPTILSTLAAWFRGANTSTSETLA